MDYCNSHLPSCDGITRFLQNPENSNNDVLKMIMPIIYPRLRAMVSRQYGKYSSDLTEQNTDILHDTYEKLLLQRNRWKNSNHFYAIAAQIIRRTIVDRLREKRAIKRGSGVDFQTEKDIAESTPLSNVDLLTLDHALNRLSEVDSESVVLIELRYFLGLSLKEVAQYSNKSLSTIKRDWRFSKAWLKNFLMSANE